MWKIGLAVFGLAGAAVGLVYLQSDKGVVVGGKFNGDFEFGARAQRENVIPTRLAGDRPQPEGKPVPPVEQPVARQQAEMPRKYYPIIFPRSPGTTGVAFPFVFEGGAIGYTIQLIEGQYFNAESKGATLVLLDPDRKKLREAQDKISVGELSQTGAYKIILNGDGRAQLKVEAIFRNR